MLVLSPALGSAQNVTTFRNDAAQTGQNLTETTLTHANVNSAQFGKLFSVHTDGRVEGQPLYVRGVTINGVNHNVMYLGTEHDSMYAFDADTGTQLWTTRVLKPGESTSPVDSCTQNLVEIGVTQTPVIDLTAGPNGAIYSVAKSKDGGGGEHQRLHALDLATGAELFGGPKDISASFPGNGEGSTGGMMHFNPAQYKERTSLVLFNGVVYTTWASWNCDARPYSAWLIGYNTTTLAQQVVFNFTPNGHQGATWGGGAGPVVDSEGNMYLMLANGSFDTTLNGSGFPNGGNYGNAFVKFAINGGGATVKDYWTMSGTVGESNGDVDLGSGAQVLLPDFTDANGVVRRLGVGAGKDRNIYVYDRDNMGHFNPNNNSGLYQQLSGALAGKHLGVPAYFNGRVYIGGSGDKIKAYKVVDARLTTAPSETTSTTFGYPGAMPSISANGTSDAILWAANLGGGGVLHAYDANNIGVELYNTSQAAGGRDTLGETTKRTSATIADGKVMVATASGAVVYGLLGGSSCGAAPTVPTGVTATTVSSTAVNLGWTASTAPSGCTVKYTITRNAAQVATGVSGTSFSDTGLTCNTSYTYTVTAVDAAGSSAASSPASATTSACTPTPTMTSTPTVTPTPTPSPSPTPTIAGAVQINSGDGAVSPWIADTDFVGGTAATNWTGAIDTSAVTNPAPQAVYQSERYGAMTYTIPGLGAGSAQTVRLHFCENFFTAAGKRVFNVSINGGAVLTNFDIFATTGAIHKANVQPFAATANGSGQVVIQFSNVTNNALVDGIEVIPASGPTPTPTATATPTGPTPTPSPTAASSLKINSGDGAVSPWVADMDFVGGTAATNWTGAIDMSAVTNPAPQAVYQSERYGASTYTIPSLVPGSSHGVRLHMCENYFTATGKRVFNVSINGGAVLTNFDIFAATGAVHKAIVKDFTATANASGQIVIQFTNVTNNALIDGVEIN